MVTAEILMPSAGKTEFFLPQIPYKNSHPDRKSMGDLRFHDQNVSLQIINTSIRRFVENRNGHSPDVDEASASLFYQISKFKKHVEANFQEKSEHIRERHLTADIKTLNQPMAARVKERIGEHSIHFVTDVDGTITQDPADYISQIPGSAVAEPRLKEKGRQMLPDVLAESWRFALQIAPSMFRDVGRSAQLRKGAKEFMRLLSEKDIPATALSANFEPVVQGVFDQMFSSREVNNVSIIAVSEDNVIATAKGDVLKHLAIQYPKRAFIYVGDSLSDLPAIEAREVIAGFFALEGSLFAQALAKENIPHLVYNDFDDIRRQLGVVSAQFSAHV